MHLTLHPVDGRAPGTRFAPALALRPPASYSLVRRFRRPRGDDEEMGSRMTQTLQKKLAEWRDADSRARTAERSLTHLLFSRLDDPPPTDEVVHEARMLRELANDKLKAAIAALWPRRPT
jgi:hypothetical protein